MITEYKHSKEMAMVIIESKLSDRFHLFTENNKRFAIFHGYVVDYATFCLMLIWALSGSKVYTKIFSSQTKRIDDIKSMNALNAPFLKSLTYEQVGYQLFNPFQRLVSGENYSILKENARNMFHQMHDN